MPCGDRQAREWLRTIPRAAVFQGSRAPHCHRIEPPWAADDWPRDPRAAAASINPGTDWPEIAARLIDDPEAKGPRSVVLSGSNDLGKSHRAADLVFRLHRAGIFGAYWVNEAELVAEMDDYTRQHWSRAKSAPVLVVDDLLSHRGGPATVEAAAGLVLDLADVRWSNPSKITIYTTHRPLSKLGAAAYKQPEWESVEAIVPAAYGRMIDGLMLHLTGKGHRGAWAGN